MDLNKEIKLSDLVRRPKKKTKARRRHEAEQREAQAAREAGDRRPQDRAPRRSPLRGSSTTAVPPRSSCSSRGFRSSPASSSAARCATSPALAEALDSFFTENKLPRRGIRLGIGTNRIGVRTVDIDGIDDERQLANAVRFSAHEALSIPLDQAVLDYHVVSETVDESGAVSRRVLLAAAYREPIDHYIEACRAARLELSGIDVEAFALLRAVAPRRADADGAPATAAVVVSIGHDRSTLAISDGTVCDFMRVLDWGGAKLEAAISRELGLTVAEAAELKLELDLGAEASTRTTIRASRAPGPRSPASCKRSRGSSSPRCSSTRGSPGRSRSRRCSSRAARRSCPDSPRSSSG